MAYISYDMVLNNAFQVKLTILLPEKVIHVVRSTSAIVYICHMSMHLYSLQNVYSFSIIVTYLPLKLIPVIFYFILGGIFPYGYGS